MLYPRKELQIGMRSRAEHMGLLISDDPAPSGLPRMAAGCSAARTTEYRLWEVAPGSGAIVAGHVSPDGVRDTSPSRPMGRFFWPCSERDVVQLLAVADQREFASQ